MFPTTIVYIRLIHFKAMVYIICNIASRCIHQIYAPRWEGQISRWQTILTFPLRDVYLVNTLHQSYGLYNVCFVICYVISCRKSEKITKKNIHQGVWCKYCLVCNVSSTQIANQTIRLNCVTHLAINSESVSQVCSWTRCFLLEAQKGDSTWQWTMVYPKCGWSQCSW